MLQRPAGSRSNPVCNRLRGHRWREPDCPWPPRWRSAPCGARRDRLHAMGPASGIAAIAGQPRSDHDASVLATFDRYMRIPIVLAAILPLVVVPESGGLVGVLVGIISWLVFLVDYIVYERRLVTYTSTWLGRFDLVVVVLTAPWYLLPGAQAGSFVVILRLARLARVLMASKGAKRLLARLGRVGLVALGVLVVCSGIAFHAEHATNPEFASFGDSLWWGIVTLTTVGYGDIVPRTPVGRWAAVCIMLTGVAVIGVLAGSLASFFRLDGSTDSDSTAKAESADGSDPTSDVPTPEALAQEMARLRIQMEHLTVLLAGQNTPEPPQSP